MIEVTDPAHPLFGRRFPLLRLCRSAHGAGFVEVRYRDTFRLRIPLDATDRATTPPTGTRTKLTPAAVQEFIALAEESAGSCRNHPSASGPDSTTP